MAAVSRNPGQTPLTLVSASEAKVDDEAAEQELRPSGALSSQEPLHCLKLKDAQDRYGRLLADRGRFKEASDQWRRDEPP